MLGIGRRRLVLIVLFLLYAAVIMTIRDQKADRRRQMLVTASAYRRARAILFCTVLCACSLRSLLYVGFTARTETGYALFASMEPWLNSAVRYLLMALVLVEVLEHPGRGMISFVFFLLYDLYHTSDNRLPLLIEMALLASLANLSGRRRTACAWLICHLLYAVMLPVLMHLGYLEETTRPRELFGIVFQGSSFGMGHPNTLGVLIATTVFLVWYLLKPQRWRTTVGICLTAAVLSWLLTFSRTATLMILALPIVSISVHAVCRSGKKALIGAMDAAPFLLLALTFLVYLVIRNHPGGFDPAFSDRFLNIELLRKTGVPMIAKGAWVEPYFARTYALDNFYVWLLATCGWLPCACVLTAHTAMSAVCVRDRDEHLLTLSLIFAVYGLMENIPAYIAFNFLAFLVFAERGPVPAPGPVGDQTAEA